MAKRKKSKLQWWHKQLKTHRVVLGVFALGFAIIGGILTYSSFALTVTLPETYADFIVSEPDSRVVTVPVDSSTKGTSMVRAVKANSGTALYGELKMQGQGNFERRYSVCATIKAGDTERQKVSFAINLDGSGSTADISVRKTNLGFSYTAPGKSFQRICSPGNVLDRLSIKNGGHTLTPKIYIHDGTAAFIQKISIRSAQP